MSFCPLSVQLSARMLAAHVTGPYHLLPLFQLVLSFYALFCLVLLEAVSQSQNANKGQTSPINYRNGLEVKQEEAV